jgi:galactose oxidase
VCSHSTAVLLPGGRVASAGSTNPTSELNAEIYSPPYLFQGTRPTISSFPDNITYNQTFFLGTPNATGITRVTWCG